MEPETDAENEETLEELLERQKRENRQRVLDLHGPSQKPEVIKNEAAHRQPRKQKCKGI